MAKTRVFPVKEVAAGDPTAIVVRSPACQRLVVYENYIPPATATHDFQYRAPAATDDPAPRTAGQIVEFKALPGQLFSKGDVLGYVETIAGNCDFAQEES